VAPWRTIQHACQVSKSGDTVLVGDGIYNERVTILHPMSLQNAAGAKPVIDGTNIAVPGSDAALVLVKNVNGVTVQGFEIRNFRTSNSDLVPAGILIEGKADQVVVRGNLVDSIENNGSVPGSINAFGIAVYGNSAKGGITHLTIDHNEVRNTKTGNSETVTINGNVDGFAVTNNMVHDVNNIGIDCIGFEGTSPIKGQDQARNGYVGLNTVYNVTSILNPSYSGSQSADGIYVDGGASIVIERNIVHNSDIGIEVTSEHGGKVASQVTVRSNLIFSNTICGLSIGGYDSQRGGTLNCAFVNNTLYENDTENSGSGEFQIQFHTKGNVFKNNILYASIQGVVISEPSGAGIPGVVSDYNLFFTSGTPMFMWGAKSCTSLASFERLSLGDKHSKFSNPLFVDPSSGNLRLAAGSIAIGAGINLGATIEGALDLIGAPRVIGGSIDLGCYESLPVVGP